MGERLSVGCQRASQSLRSAQAPANHLRSLLHFLLFRVSLSFSPFSVFSLPVFKPRLHSFRLSLPRVSSFSQTTSLSILYPSSRSLFRVFAPSFPSVPSSPRCSLLQARYNAARRRPSCIFKRAVLLCSRYRSHHLDRPLDDRSPPSPTSGPPSLCDARSFPCPLSIFLPSLRVLS